MLKNRTVLFADMNTLWGNNGGFVEPYRCAPVLYLLSMLAHAYNFIIDRVVGAPVHAREVIDGMNVTKKILSMLMTTVQLPGTESY